MRLFTSKTTDNSFKQEGVVALLDNAQHHKDFYVLLIGAALLAIGGVFADSIPVLIASMIVAPLAYPILALSIGMTTWDVQLIGRAVGLLVASCVVALVIAIIATLLFDDIRVRDVYITFTGNRYLAAAVAVVAGAIAAYGAIRPRVASAITGVAIAVSLMPPLVATGIGLASASVELANDAAILFLINVVGILAGSIAVFLVFRVNQRTQ